MKINISQLEIPKPTIQASQALQMIAEPDTDINELGKLIMQDPLLAGAVLRYANSPINRRSTEISNVPTALNLLGLKSIRSAIVSATLHSLLSDATTLDKEILQHMLNISIICRLVARVLCQQQEYDLEFLGLVHDIGMLVMATNFEVEYLELFQKSQHDKIAIDILEEQEFSLNHGLVSAHVAQEYRLPKIQIELLRKFHDSDGIESISKAADRDRNILSLAHLLLEEITPNDAIVLETLAIDLAQLQEQLKISDSQLDQLREEIKISVKV